jgi:hypothetical protein
MNRLYLIGEEGNILFIEPANEYLKLLNLNCNLRKISTSYWCSWCLSSNFQLKIYVPKLMQIRFTAETYENQVTFKIYFSKNKILRSASFKETLQST